MNDPRMRQALRTGLRRGLIGGCIVLLVALVGMVESFTKRQLITDWLDLGQVAWLGAVLLSGYGAARDLLGRDEDRPAPVPALVAGAAAGLAAGAVVVALIVLGTQLDVGAVFDKARPQLYELLSLGGLDRETFGEMAPAGVGERLALLASVLLRYAWAPWLACAAMGLLGAAVHLLPGKARGAVGVGTLVVLIMGTIQDLLTKIDFIERSTILQGIYDALYTRSGMTVLGALLLWLLTSGLRLVWPDVRERVAAVLPAPLVAGERGRGPGGLPLRYLVGLAVLALFLLWFPFGFGKVSADVMDLVGIYILMGLGLNIVVGFAGLLDLGYVAFFAIGAYTVGILTSTDPDAGIQVGWTLWQALPVAILFTILAGVILGVPVLKTHGDYLAIITLGFGEIIRILAISDALKPVMGGAQGITLIPKPFDLPELTLPLAGAPSDAFWGRLDPGIQQEVFFPILLAVIVAAYVSWRLRHSRFGRAWMALREDENVAEAMGINLVSTKLLAFATGAVFAGVGGALFASKLGSIYPSSFGLLVSINVLVLIIVGGMGSIPGVFVGALAIVGLPELLREFEDFRLLLYGAVLVVMMLNRPEGLWPAAIVRRELGRDKAAAVGPGDSGSAGAGQSASAGGEA